MSTLKIGFLGTGWIATTYAKALAAIPGVQITALCNRHLEKAQRFNADHAGGKANCYDNFNQMLQREPLDALWICMPPGAHNGEAEAAARRGIHLMLEKPIALSIERAESIRAAVREGSVKVQIGHHMRHTAPSIKLKQMLADGSAGLPVFMQGRFFTNALFPTWWRDPNMGGGQLVEQSIHLYDLARHFFGEPESASGYAANRVHQRFADYRVDDVSASSIRFKSGAIANLCAANVWEPKSGSVEFVVMCEKVLAKFSSPDSAEFVYHNGIKSEEVDRDKVEVRREQISGGSPYVELCRNFIDGIRRDTPIRSGIDDGAESLRLVLGIADSSRRGGEVVRF